MEIAVVGGGIAGLTAGGLLAQRGARVTVFEAAGELGGRARTVVRDGYSFNLGAHALYRRGAGWRVRRCLDVKVTGGTVSRTALALVRDGALLPGRALIRDGGEVARLSARLIRQELHGLSDSSVTGWLDDQAPGPGARQVFEALVRLTTYTAEHDRLSIDAAATQFRIGARGSVRYLDGGWRSLVRALRAAAERAGAVVAAGDRVLEVEHDDRVRAVRLASGRRLRVDGAVLAVGGPGAARALTGDGPGAEVLARWEAQAVPVRAACLDLALSRAPRPRLYAIGLDEPTYASVHSTWGALAPPGSALVHTAWYLREGDAPEAARARLEALLDLAQPGWRGLIVHERFLPRMEVTAGMPLASAGGLPGRPGPLVPGVEGLAVAGDWVGGEGLLADASFASAERAAALLLARARPGVQPAARPGVTVASP
jgi:phytoene dehydrogenase-like protein